MADRGQLELLKRGAREWNRWRQESPDAGIDLAGADLRGIDLSLPDRTAAAQPGSSKFMQRMRRGRLPSHELGVDLHGAELKGARLNDANLMRANLAGAGLRDAKLSGAQLREANLAQAELANATLVETDLREAVLGGAKLRRANLSYANLRGAIARTADFTGADLSWCDLRGVDAHEAILIDADLSHANLTKANLWHGRLAGANLTQAQMVFTDLSHADLTGCSVFGVSAWGVNLAEAAQAELVVSRADQPRITVDRLEMAQFIYLLIYNPNIRHVIHTIGNKGVLLLGRFRERKPVLEALRAELRKRDYVPLVYDFEGAAEHDLTETVLTLAGMSKFVIADITKPRSVPHELAVLLPNYMIPFKPIMQKGETPYAMFGDYRKRFEKWVLPRLEYRDVDQLIGVIDAAILEQVEARHAELLLDKAAADEAEDADDFE